MISQRIANEIRIWKNNVNQLEKKKFQIILKPNKKQEISYLQNEET